MSFLLVGIAVSLLGRPFIILVHELGHTVAALLLDRQPVLVVVGRPPHVRGQLGRLTLVFSLLPTRGVRLGGLCRRPRSTNSVRREFVIVLAGPLASLLLAVASWWACYRVAIAGHVTLTLILLWVGLYALVDFLVNIDSRPTGPDDPLSRDACKLKLLWRLWRQGWVPPTTAPWPEPSTSVPPPMSGTGRHGGHNGG